MKLHLLWFMAVVITTGCVGQTTHTPAPVGCPGSVSTTVSPIKPTVSVSYSEPAVTVEGNSLRGLAKTTIYYDLGSGRTVAKEVPASAPAGGGQISETITVPLPEPRETLVRICVTATDRYGHESLTNP